jgi:O-antigen/teichoic acid export membrane protein
MAGLQFAGAFRSITGLMSEPAINIAPDTEYETQQFRSQVGQISRQSGVLFAGTIFTAALGYLFKIYLARVLGAEQLGIYALGMTLVGFVGAFNSLGLVESAVRFSAEYRAAGKLPELRALLWRGAGALLAANVFFAAIFLEFAKKVARPFYHSPLLAQYIPWFAILLVLGAMSTFYSRILAGYKALDRRALITNFLGTPATMLFALILIGIGWGLRGYLMAQVLGSVLVIALLLRSVWKLTPHEARFLLPWPAPLGREVWSFSTTAVGVLLLGFLMGQVDKIALGFYRGARDVGIYSVAAALVAYMSVILNSVNQVFSPLIADLRTRGDNAMLERLYKALTKWVLGLTLPLAITVMIFSHPLMGIFGPEFERGWPILIIGTAGQLVNCGVGSVGLLLFMSGNQRRLLHVQAAMAVVMTVASAALVPLWGIVGAAVAAAITNAGTNVWNLLTVRKVLRFSPFSLGFARLLPPTIACVLVALIVRREAGMFGHNWLAIIVGIVSTYGIFAGVTGVLGLDADDRLIARAIWSRLRRI